MLDKAALQHIQRTAHIPELIQHIQGAETQVPLALTPDDMNIRSLEKYMPSAARYRLRFETDSIEDFIRYNKKHDQEGATCFIDAEKMSAHSIYDLGTEEEPLHKENRASLFLTQTAGYRALLCLNGRALDQKSVADFLEDWTAEIVVRSADKEAMSNKDAAASLRDLTIESAKSLNSKIDDFGASMTKMEEIEAKNKERLPAYICFTINPYHGLDEREFEVRLSILTGDEKPRVSLRILRLESQQEDMAKEFKEIIEDSALDFELETFIGRTE